MFKMQYATELYKTLTFLYISLLRWLKWIPVFLFEYFNNLNTMVVLLSIPFLCFLYAFLQFL